MHTHARHSRKNREAITMAEATLHKEKTEEADNLGFVDRRQEASGGAPIRERRQFTNSHEGLSEEAAELAQAIDSYKARHRRRFINYEEMLVIVKSLGYSR